MSRFAIEVAELFISGEVHGCRKHTQKLLGVDLGSASQLANLDEKTLKEYVLIRLCDEEHVDWSKRVWNHKEYYQYQDTCGEPGHEALFNGPCVVLTSRATVSAAEDFAAFFRSSRRAKLIGTPTQGTTGTPLNQPLSSGSAQICTVGYCLLDGTEFVGKGIQPDVLIEPTIEDLKNVRDPVLEYALEYLK